MKKLIKVELLQRAEDFYDSLPEEIQKKFLRAFDKTTMGLKGDWFKKMPGTDDIYEFRVEGNNSWYRMFAFWDSTKEEATLIVCSNGIQKKSNKTDKSDIKVAEEIKKDYFT
jgi:phage-related protein